MKIVFEHCKKAYYSMAQVERGIMRIPAKLDTGAAKTIIGLGALSDAFYTQNFCECIMQYAVNNSIGQNTFIAANNEYVKTYPCFFDNVWIDKEKIGRFAFELINNIESKKFLVGDDFICCCKFSHEISGNIIFTEFDNVKYDTSIRQPRINMNKLIDDHRKLYLSNSEFSQSNSAVDEFNELVKELHS